MIRMSVRTQLMQLPYLSPATAREPIKLDEYLKLERRSRLVDDARLTDAWKAWYDARA